MQLFKVAMLALILVGAVHAQVPGGEQIRVHEISLAAGAQTELRAHADALLIPFGNDLDGRAPLEPVTWRAAGTTSLDNRGTTPFNALLVELVAPRSEGTSSIPPEALAAATTTGSTLYSPVEGRRVRTVLDNARVLVTAHRLPQFQPVTEARHWHTREMVFVYLSGGELSGSTAHLVPQRVRRGAFDVLPANMPHALNNVGNDPVEFLLITPK